MRRYRAAVFPFAVRHMPVKGWRREEPGSGEGGSGGGAGDDTGKTDDGDDTGAGKDPKIDGDFDAERAKRTIASAREGEKKANEKAKASDARLKAVLKAMGLGEDGKADPETQAKELTSRAEAAEARATKLAIKNAIRDGADKHKANAAELLDSQSFLSKLGDLDAAADDFDDKVADLVKAAVKANPGKFGAQTGQGAGARGADHSGGSNRPARSKDLSSAVAKRLGG